MTPGFRRRALAELGQEGFELIELARVGFEVRVDADDVAHG